MPRRRILAYVRLSLKRMDILLEECGPELTRVQTEADVDHLVRSLATR